MTALALVIGLWLAVLVPPAVKRHQERRQEFLESFQVGLGALGATTPPASVFDLEGGAATPAARPHRTATAGRRADRPSPAQRRRTILALLLGSMGISAVPVVVVGGKAALAVFLAVSNCFLAYVALVVRRRDARPATVRPKVLATTDEPELLWDDDDEPLIVSAPRVRAAV